MDSPNFDIAARRAATKMSVDICCTGSVASIKIPLLTTQLLSALQQHTKFVRLRLFPTVKSTHFFTAEQLPANVELVSSQDSEPGLGQCDLVIIAPLDANTLAELYYCVACSNSTSASEMAQHVWHRWTMYPSTPTLIAPAMNTNMWRHPLTVKHCNAILGAMPNIYFLPTVEKRLICGDVGFGAMAEVNTIVDAALACILQRGTVTLIPRLSPIDSVPTATTVSDLGAGLSNVIDKKIVLCLLDDNAASLCGILHAFQRFHRCVTEIPGFLSLQIACSRRSAEFIQKVLQPEMSNMMPFKVVTDDDEWNSWKQRGDPVLHIELARDCDIMFVISSCAAARKFVLDGRCPTLASCVVRAWQLTKPHYYIPIENDDAQLPGSLKNKVEADLGINHRLQQELQYVTLYA